MLIRASVVKISEYTRAGATTLTSDPEMLFTRLVPNQWYQLFMRLVFRSSADTTGWQWGMSLPGVTTILASYGHQAAGAAGLYYNGITGGINTGGSSAIDAVNVGGGYDASNALADMTFKLSAPGTLQLTWGPFANVADTLTLKAGSYMILEQTGAA